MRKISFLIPIMLFMVGCVNTSPTFKAAIRQAAPAAAAEVRKYHTSHDWDINGDKTLSEAEVSEQKSEREKIDAFELSTANYKAITAADFSAKFADIEPRWRFYINNDPKLNSPGDREIRLGLPDMLSAITRAELARQAQAAAGIFAPPNN